MSHLIPPAHLLVVMLAIKHTSLSFACWHNRSRWIENGERRRRRTRADVDPTQKSDYDALGLLFVLVSQQKREEDVASNCELWVDYVHLMDVFLNTKAQRFPDFKCRNSFAHLLLVVESDLSLCLILLTPTKE